MISGLDAISIESIFLVLLNKSVSYLNRQTRTLLKVVSAQAVMESALAGQISRQKAKEESPGAMTDPKTAETQYPSLEKFASNMTLKMQDNDVEPVLFREEEILKLTGILLQKKKNNVMLVGEPGVGKTAVVEGFAQYLNSEKLPEKLKQTQLWEIDLTALQAGASVKGEFENRIKNLLEDIKNYHKPVILFVDEAHMLMGAGGAQGTSDAANMLKRALARGLLKMIGATTWSEYKKYIEKDAAFSRRFQQILIDPPSLSESGAILRGLVPFYQNNHGVRITDCAIDAAVGLSDRYLSDRQLPDKALDLLDMACAAVASSLATVPKKIQIAQRDLKSAQNEYKACLADEQAGFPADTARKNTLKQTIGKQEKALSRLEKTAAQHRQRIEAYHELMAGYDGQENKEEDTQAIRAIKAARRAIDTASQSCDFFFHVVDNQVVSHVLAGITGIPVSMIRADAVSRVRDLDKTLAANIKGQDSAIEAIHQALLASAADVRDPLRPVGSFLLVGPSGVGKTETALQLAEHFYGSQSFLTQINMSEYQEKHTVSRLIGSPPGYVGYGEGGVLTEAMRQKPYSLVLLDEVEKAHPDVLNIFYQGFDKGEIMDGEGRKINCRNILFLMTSNIGFDTIEHQYEPLSDDDMRNRLLGFFKPALLARMDIVQYTFLSQKVLRQIVTIKLNKVVQRIRANYKAELDVVPGVYDAVSAAAGVHANGARLIDNIINKQILPQLSRAVLDQMAMGRQPGNMTLSHEDGYIVTQRLKRKGQKNAKRSS